MRPPRGGRAAASLRAAGEALRAPSGDPLAQDGLGESLRRRSARGALSTVAGQWVRLILQIGSTVVLARLIAPEEYGLVGMVLALIGIGDAVLNLGLSQATVQRRDVNTMQVTFFFWLQASVGAFLTLATMALAGTIADFYGHDQLVPLTMVLATMFLINGLAAQHQAVLSRQMRFGALALIDLLGLVCGVILAIAIAALGGGAWALVAQTMAVPVCRLLLSWKASGWRPGPPRRVTGVSGMVRFGLNLTATNALDYSAENVDNVLIGRFYGAEALGLYSRAYSLLLLPIRQVTEPLARVAVPVLSLLQGEPERYRRFFTVALSSVAYVSLPLICLLSALSHEVIALMLGARWAGVAPIFQILAFAGMIISLRSTNGWLFVSTGQMGRQATWARSTARYCRRNHCWRAMGRHRGRVGFGRGPRGTPCPVLHRGCEGDGGASDGLLAQYLATRRSCRGRVRDRHTGPHQTRGGGLARPGRRRSQRSCVDGVGDALVAGGTA